MWSPYAWMWWLIHCPMTVSSVISLIPLMRQSWIRYHQIYKNPFCEIHGRFISFTITLGQATFSIKPIGFRRSQKSDLSAFGEQLGNPKEARSNKPWTGSVCPMQSQVFCTLCFFSSRINQAKFKELLTDWIYRLSRLTLVAETFMLSCFELIAFCGR